MTSDSTIYKFKFHPRRGVFSHFHAIFGLITHIYSEILIFFMSMNPGTYFPLIYINQKRVAPQNRMKMDFNLLSYHLLFGVIGPVFRPFLRY